MLQSQERIALALLIGVCIAIISVQLLIDAVGWESFARPYDENCREGDLVRLEGTIETLALTSTGGHLVLEINGTRVFIPGEVASSLDLQEGDHISLIGVVSRYNGNPEVVLSSAEDLMVK